MPLSFLASLFGKRPAKTPPKAPSAAAPVAPTPKPATPMIASPSPASVPAAAAANSAVVEPAPVAVATPGAATPVDQASMSFTPSGRRASRVISLDTPPMAEGALAYGEELREVLASAIRRLEATLDDKQRVTDAGALLRELSGDPSGAIRQLPMAAQKALALLNQDPSDAQLTKHFERDPSVTQAILQQANGAYYNPSGKRVLALSDAVKRLGRSGVRNVLLHQAVQGMVCRPGGEYDAMVQKAWTHMVRTAQVARAIAPAFDAEREQAFALALLHDAGKLVVFDRLAALRSRLRRAPNIERTIIRRTLRLIHEPMGGLGVLAWGLGLDAAHAVATHHREPVPAQRDPLSEVLFVAERMDLARQKATPFDAEGAWSAGQLTGSIDEAVRLADAERKQAA
jgi:HD-like signal output (HDOD) protein